MGLAKFDSATAMVQAAARFLHGEGFPGLGQPTAYQYAVGFADLVPRKARQALFARLGAVEAVVPETIHRVSTAAIARWAADLYPRRRYPAVVVGSSSGALVHFAAALGAPWLPQTFLTLVKQRVHPDEPAEAMEAGRSAGHRFLAANPDVQLHHMHDPSQDRLMLRHVAYFRWKFRRLPGAYREFIHRTLEPGGTLIVAECESRWPTTRLDERHVFQAGALGGASSDEYLRGGPRVEAFLARCGSHRNRGRPPPADSTSPEAEWGFEPALRADLLDLAQERNCRVVRLCFDEPDGLSPAVADLHRAWNRDRGIDANRLLIESFILLDPHHALRTGSVPFWMRFNTEASLERVLGYLRRSEAFDDIHLVLFAHGVDSIGLPPVEAWRTVLAQARRRGAFLGVNEHAYPAHFATFARFGSEVRQLGPSFPLPSPMTLDDLLRLFPDDAAAQVRLTQTA